MHGTGSVSLSDLVTTDDVTIVRLTTETVTEEFLSFETSASTIRTKGEKVVTAEPLARGRATSRSPIATAKNPLASPPRNGCF